MNPSLNHMANYCQHISPEETLVIMANLTRNQITPAQATKALCGITRRARQW